MYTIVVSNVGTVYAEGEAEFRAAVDEYYRCVGLSAAGVGRYADEEVTLYEDGKIKLSTSNELGWAILIQDTERGEYPTLFGPFRDKVSADCWGESLGDDEEWLSLPLYRPAYD